MILNDENKKTTPKQKALEILIEGLCDAINYGMEKDYMNLDKLTEKETQKTLEQLKKIGGKLIEQLEGRQK